MMCEHCIHHAVCCIIHDAREGVFKFPSHCAHYAARKWRTVADEEPPLCKPVLVRLGVQAAPMVLMRFDKDRWENVIGTEVYALHHEDLWCEIP